MRHGRRHPAAGHRRHARAVRARGPRGRRHHRSHLRRPTLLPGLKEMRPRLLLLLPTTTYRTAAFVEAARQIGVELTVASEQASTFEGANPAGLLTLDFKNPQRAADDVRVFARRQPIQGVVGVDDDTAIVEAFIKAHGRLQAILAQPEAAACGEPAWHYLVEEFIPGYEVALEGLVVNRRLHVLAIFDKPDPLDGPFFEETIYVTPSTVPAGLQASIKDCAERAVRALGITEGPVHAELRYNENGPWLIELAARPIGGRCSAGLRFWDKGISFGEILLRPAPRVGVPLLQRPQPAAGGLMISISAAGGRRRGCRRAA